MKEASIRTHLDSNQEALTRSNYDPNQVEGLERVESGHGKSITFDFSSDTKVFNTEEKRHMVAKDPSLFPDGGLRAWSVVAASFLLVFCTFGGSRHDKY